MTPLAGQFAGTDPAGRSAEERWKPVWAPDKAGSAEGPPGLHTFVSRAA